MPDLSKQTTETTDDSLDFDWDEWIGGRSRPTGRVLLHPGNDALEAELAESAATLAAFADDLERAERTSPENRGLGDASPEVVQAQAEAAREKHAALLAKYQAQSRTFELKQVTQVEIAEAHERSVADGVDKDDAAMRTLYVVAAAITSPGTTPAQLVRLRDRDRSGAKMVQDLTAGVLALLDVSAPFSQGSWSAPS